MVNEIKLGKLFTDVIDQSRNLHHFSSDFKDEKWPQQLTQVAQDFETVSSWANEYDISPTLKFSGARAYLKIVLGYFAEISEVLNKLQKDPKNKGLHENIKVLRGQCFALSSMAHLMKRMHKNHSINSKKSAQFYKEAADGYIKINERNSPENLMDFYNPKYLTPWFPQWLRTFLRLMCIMTFLFSESLFTSLPKFSNENVNRWYAFFGTNFTIDSWSSPLTRGMNNIFYKMYVWVLNLRYWGIEVSTLTLEKRQSEWFIDSGGKKIGRNKDSAGHEKGVKCVLVKPRNFTSDHLVVHVHGGAFISFTAESYTSVLLSTAKSTGAAVLSIEYTLSPEAKYPMSLQEVLDVYLNLVSTDPITGFKPKKIILMGDSAGGYFILTTCIAVAEIREMQKCAHEKLTRLPDAIFAFYPITSLCVGSFWPSRCLLDIVLPPSCLFSVTNAYSGPVDEAKYLKEHGCPWYKDKNLLEKFVTCVNERFDDPFFNMITYEHFERLQDISLYIQVGEFDPILGDSIALSRLWKGPISWDILPFETHGWMTFEIYIPNLFPGCRIMNRKLKLALEGDSKVNSSKISNNNNNNNSNSEVNGLK